jgi:hypothetical protein
VSEVLAVESAAFVDVLRLVTALEEQTEAWPAEFALELDGRVVGWVEGGKRDPMLKDGLIEPWRQRLIEWGVEPEALEFPTL